MIVKLPPLDKLTGVDKVLAEREGGLEVLEAKYDLYKWHCFMSQNFLGKKVVDTTYDKNGKAIAGEGFTKHLCTLLMAHVSGYLRSNMVEVFNDDYYADFTAITASAGIGKSLLMGSFLSFMLMHFPRTRIGYIVASKQQAESIFAGSLIEAITKMPTAKDIKNNNISANNNPHLFFKYISGGYTFKKKGNMYHMLNKQNTTLGYFEVITAEQQIQGKDIDLMIYDDLATKEDSHEILIKKEKFTLSSLDRLRSSSWIREVNGKSNFGLISINNNVAENDTSRLIAKNNPTKTHYISYQFQAERDEEYVIRDKNNKIIHRWERKQGQVLNELHQSITECYREYGDWEDENNPMKEQAFLSFQRKFQLKLHAGDMFCFKTECISRRWGSYDSLPIKSNKDLIVFIDTASSTEEHGNHTVAILFAIDVYKNGATKSFDVYALAMMKIRQRPEDAVHEIVKFLDQNYITKVKGKEFKISEVVIENASSGSTIGSMLDKRMKNNTAPRIPIAYINRNKTTDQKTSVEHIRVKGKEFGMKTCFRAFKIAPYINQGHLILPADNLPQKHITDEIIKELKFIRGVDTGDKVINNKNDDITSCIADAFIEAETRASRSFGVFNIEAWAMGELEV